MKKTALIVLATLILAACPVLNEDQIPWPILKFDDKFYGEDGLDEKTWFRILTVVGDRNGFVRLDLSNAPFLNEDNEGGGLKKVSLQETDAAGDPTGTPYGPLGSGGFYIAFDPFPDIGWGKDKIVEIILPDAAQMINQATDKRVGREDGKFNSADRENSAFNHFVNLQSVVGNHIVLIGNFAFAGRNRLERVHFPRVGHNVTPAELSDSGNTLASGFRVDIGHFAFSGCTALRSATFNSAAVIGRYAFQGCVNLASISFPYAWMIGQNAFEDCKKLTDVFFEKVTKIGNAAFKGCTSLRRAVFADDPARFTSSAPLVGPPPLPVYDSVIFYDNAFSGCTSLQILDVRSAWNVFFGPNVLENTGSAISLYLFDDDGTRSYGHPQQSPFLGTGQRQSIRTVNIHVLSSGEKVDVEESNNIASFIKDAYPTVNVNVVRTGVAP